jgi:hypothetical protein
MVGPRPARHLLFHLWSNVGATVERAAPHFDESHFNEGWNSITIDLPGDGPAGREAAAR